MMDTAKTLVERAVEQASKAKKSIAEQREIANKAMAEIERLRIVLSECNGAITFYNALAKAVADTAPANTIADDEAALQIRGAILGLQEAQKMVDDAPTCEAISEEVKDGE